LFADHRYGTEEVFCPLSLLCALTRIRCIRRDMKGTREVTRENIFNRLLVNGYKRILQGTRVPAADLEWVTLQTARRSGRKTSVDSQLRIDINRLLSSSEFNLLPSTKCELLQSFHLSLLVILLGFHTYRRTQQWRRHGESRGIELTRLKFSPCLSG
jgi:hypothetical protein